MKILYIGQYSEGTTSKMRADQLKKLLPSSNFNIIDTNIPFDGTNRVYKSIGFRFKIGPLIRNINEYILLHLFDQYDIIWVDKGVFLTYQTILILRGRAEKIIHYTPDCAFYENKSKHFIRCLPVYDIVVTTKSFEKQFYLDYLPSKKILCVTQGYDSQTHRPISDFVNKKDQVVFIGLYEDHRGEIISSLVNAGIQVGLAGKNWGSFVSKYKKSINLTYYGDAIFGKRYTEIISDAKLALGLLSKRFPELHTTRTLEIPACGTALVTEVNEETCSIFNHDEAIFYQNKNDLISSIKYFMNNPEDLKVLTRKGMEKVINGGFDYKSILDRVISEVLDN